MFSRVRVLEYRATDNRGNPELEGNLLGRRGDTDVLFSSVLVVICSVVVAPRRVPCDRLRLIFFLSEVRSLCLADATAFFTLP